MNCANNNYVLGLENFVLGVVFFFVFMPFGLIAKILGKDPMKRKLDDTINFYRVDREPSASENLENPYR